MIPLLLFAFVTSTFSLSCLNEKGDFVETWTILKAPQTADDYLYAEENKTLYKPDLSLNDTTTGALSKTLQQLWNTDVSYLLYNDEPPFSTSYNFSVGHTKGVLAVDNTQTGFWIVHSIPQFPVGPAEADTYLGLLSNAYTYGQNAFCISISATTADQLAFQFHLNIPNLYDTYLTNEVKEKYKNITSLVEGHYLTNPICSSTPLTSINGTKHMVFAKTKQWNNDLWSGCVAPSLQNDFSVESWLRGSEIGPSCSKFQVTDVESVYFNSDFNWSEFNDHSKWATSIDGVWTCHGDINRMTTQFVRGGGAICYKGNEDLLKAIVSQNSC